MFGDLNMKREEIRNNKYFQEVMKYNYSVIMNDNINEYTRIGNVLDEIQTSYIDYITHLDYYTDLQNSLIKKKV